MDDHAGVGSFTEVSEGTDQPFLGDNNVDAGVDEGLNQPLKVLETIRGVIGCAVVDGIQTPRPLGSKRLRRSALSMDLRGCRLHQRFVWPGCASELATSPDEHGLFS